jgi:hypothetical protein
MDPGHWCRHTPPNNVKTQKNASIVSYRVNYLAAKFKFIL